MKKLLVITLLILLGCSEKEKKQPDVLSKREIVDIMLHLTIMEQKLSIMKIPKDSAEQMYDYYRNNLLKEKGIDRTYFDESYNHYLINDLNGLEEIQNTMIDSLTKYKNTLKIF